MSFCCLQLYAWDRLSYWCYSTNVPFRRLVRTITAKIGNGVPLVLVPIILHCFNFFRRLAWDVLALYTCTSTKVKAREIEGASTVNSCYSWTCTELYFLNLYRTVQYRIALVPTVPWICTVQLGLRVTTCVTHECFNPIKILMIAQRCEINLISLWESTWYIMSVARTFSVQILLWFHFLSP